MVVLRVCRMVNLFQTIRITTWLAIFIASSVHPLFIHDFDCKDSRLLSLFFVFCFFFQYDFISVVVTQMFNTFTGRPVLAM